MPRIAEVRTGSDKKKQYLNVKTLYRTLRIFSFFYAHLESQNYCKRCQCDYQNDKISSAQGKASFLDFFSSWHGLIL